MTAPAIFSFRLYVAGDAHNSMRAIANLTALCDDRLKGRHHIEIVDVFGEPDRALADRIVMTPTLIRVKPSPTRRIIGTLDHTDSVAVALDIGRSRG
jgi:circadian clock protein KaiB